MLVYVVTAGEYDEYGINAVYTDKLKAEKHVELLNSIRYPEYARIEEYVSDEEDVFIAYSVFLNFPTKFNDKGRPRGLNYDEAPELTHSSHKEIVRFLPEPRLHIDRNRPDVYTGSAWGYSIEDATERLYAAIRAAEENKE